ncbi:MAG: ABC transporter ATP-binding protein [Acidobacteriota bacterium]|nr:ABC transporter ATP-binding protein [Acidobacteriota bacterium]
MIVVENVSKTYGRLGRRVRALDTISLEVRRGETLGLIGPNGAGKTTLLSCLLGFLNPDTGRITVDGKPPDDLAVRARTGYLPERLGFDRDLPGRLFLAHHWRLAGGDPKRAGAEAEAAADRVGLERDILKRALKTYSRGMLQRIGLAQALLREPQLLFLDEPASGTDPVGVGLVRQRILEAKARGATIVLNSHQLAEVERVCDRIVFLSEGRLVRSETLGGQAPSRRRGRVRVPGERLIDASAILVAEAFQPEAEPDGSLRFSVSSDEDMARAVRALALAGVSVYEAKVSAELEELFSENPRA